MEKKYSREEFKKYLENRINGFMNDIRTYTWLKNEEKETYVKGVEKYGVGGGNFVGTLGLFCVLDFMGQVYSILRKGQVFKKGEKEWDTLLKKDPIIHDFYKRLIEDRVITEDWTDLNHNNAFKKLIKDSQVITGLQEEQINKIWDDYRNSLTHMIFPKRPIVSVLTEQKIDLDMYELIIKLINSSSFSFDEQNEESCELEPLYKDVEKIKIWLLNKILDENQTSEKDLRELLFWLLTKS